MLKIFQCSLCKHHEYKWKCKAFPNGKIPREIMFGKVLHITPLPEQDNEIIFELKEGEDYYEKLYQSFLKKHEDLKRKNETQ